MCSTCQQEYEDPANRRFHAQPNACPDCGPHLQLKTSGTIIQDQVIQQVVELLRQGQIIAVKGLGGYHLACDAKNEAAVTRLRQRKQRWAKPFALMIPKLTMAQTLCQVSAQEQALLNSHQRPIVLLQRNTLGAEQVSPSVAPGNNSLGLMLPYTPLHVLMMKEFDGPLVMTSGNQSDEPIAYHDVEAQERLFAMADAFLSHNRPIQIRCDDTLMRVMAAKPVMLRRSRGYAPQPLKLSSAVKQPILAVGAHLKNTFCLVSERHAYLSQHIGDLENMETLTAFQDSITHFKHIFDLEPAIIAHDLHPDYLSTRWAQGDIDSKKSKIQNPKPVLSNVEVSKIVGVQHHHAHIASVMAEHHLSDPVIGLAYDGTGYGPDGTIWGGEVLLADCADFQRLAHLAPVLMPGGGQAVRQPWRMAAAYLYQVYGEEFVDLPLDFTTRLDQTTWRGLKSMMDRQVNTPLTSSMGRLFDAVAALIGLHDEVSYEGQAAIALEMLATQVNDTIAYPLLIREGQVMMLETAPLMRAIVADLQDNVPQPVIAARFHQTVIEMSVAFCKQVRFQTGVSTVALSGGVFQNKVLLEGLSQNLNVANFEVYFNQQVPSNDGGLSLGQAVVAAARVNC